MVRCHDTYQSLKNLCKDKPFLGGFFRGWVSSEDSESYSEKLRHEARRDTSEMKTQTEQARTTKEISHNHHFTSFLFHFIFDLDSEFLEAPRERRYRALKPATQACLSGESSEFSTFPTVIIQKVRIFCFQMQSWSS
jgi:hypothetical protein